MDSSTIYTSALTGQQTGFTGLLNQMTAKSANKNLLFIAIADATPSMEEDGKIGAVNVAMQELVSLLKQFSTERHLNIRFVQASFTNSVRWELEVNDIQQCLDVPSITARPGSTQYSEVYHALNKRLTREDLLNFPGKKVAPIIVFLTDGEPSDSRISGRYLEELKKNSWFTHAIRSAVLMGDAANSPKAQAAVAEFVSDENSILSADSTAQIIDQICLATLHTLMGTEDDAPAPAPEQVAIEQDTEELKEEKSRLL